MLTPLEKQAIEQACIGLSSAYARAIDFRDHEGFVELFTADAELIAGRVLEGRAAIRDAINRRPDNLRTRHLLSNHFIDVQEPERARGIVYLTLYRSLAGGVRLDQPAELLGPAAVGHYEDRYQLTDEG